MEARAPSSDVGGGIIAAGKADAANYYMHINFTM